MSDVLSQIPGLAGYLAMQNQRRQAAAQEFQNVSGLAAALRQHEQADREAQMAPLDMEYKRALVGQAQGVADTRRQEQEFQQAFPQLVQQATGPDGALNTEQLIAGLLRTPGGAKTALELRKSEEDRALKATQASALVEQRREQAQMMHETRMSQAQTAAERAAETARHNRFMEGLSAQLRNIQAQNAGGGGKLSVVQTDQGMMLTDGRGNFRPAIGPDGKPLRAPISASEARVQRDLAKQEARDEGIKSRLNLVLEKVDEALKNTGILSAGFIGGTMAGIRGTPAYDLDKTVDTIKANIGFQELQAMRDASPTGGALGQVAVKELDMLQATLSSIEVGQSPAQLRSNLQKVKTHYQNWLNTLEKAKTSDEPNPTGAAPTRIKNDAEFNALPSGAKFIGPDGKTRTKP